MEKPCISRGKITHTPDSLFSIDQLESSQRDADV